MILFLDQYGGIAGGQTVLLSLVKAALTVDHQVTVLAPGGGDLQIKMRERFQGAVRFVPCEEISLSKGVKRWTDIIAAISYTFRFLRNLHLLRSSDIVYVNGPRQIPTIMLLSPFFRRKTIYHIHVDHSRLEKLVIRAAKKLPNTFAVICNSKFTAKRLGHFCKTVENALDDRFSNIPFVNRFSEPTARACAAVIGTVAKHKGQDIAIAAVANLPLDLHLVGPKPSENYPTLYPGQNNVYIDGPATDIPATFDGLKIQFNLVPSVWEEAFGLVAIEGMACSAITIVSGQGELKEIAKRTGALVAENQGALTEVLTALLNMPKDHLAALAKAQYDATMKFYSPARFQSDIIKLLRASRAGI